MRKSAWVVCLLILVLGPNQSNGQVNVTTWHNDNWRTGQNTSEIHLTNGINKDNFGLLCKIPLLSTPQQEQVYAQPLVVANSNGMTVYVPTMQDNVYAFNVPNTWTSQTCGLLKNTALVRLLRGTLAGQFPADVCFIGNGPVYDSCSDPRQPSAICPSAGVLGTPVIDTVSNTMYLITESQDTDTGQQGVNCKTKSPPNHWYHYLHALDLTSSTLAEKFNGPVQINPSGGNNGFQSQQLLQRPGLLWLDNNVGSGMLPAVFIAFSMMDGTKPNPSGWVVGFDAQNLTATPQVFDTTPNVAKFSPAGGGIWQGGAGLAAGCDANCTTNSTNHYLYLSTADGVYDSNGDYGDSYLKLNTSVQLSGSYTPSDSQYRWDNDMDLGSAGEMLPPDNILPAPYDHMVIKGDKEQIIWVLDRTNPATVLQQLSISGSQSRSTPAFWNDGTNSFIYTAQQYTDLQQYQLSANCSPGPICTPAVSTSQLGSPVGVGYAATPSVSSNGNQNNGTGIVWAVKGNTTDKVHPDGLYAFDAENLASELYDSYQCVIGNSHVDQPGEPTKFSVPTVANGYVFIATQTDFDVYGPINPPRTCQ